MSNDSLGSNHRVAAPSTEDADSLREYGRQLAMNSLIEEALSDDKIIDLLGKGRAPSKRPWLLRAWLPAAAAVLLMATGAFFWKSLTTPAAPIVATLDARWKLQASDGADYRILHPNHIELRSGEVRFTSTQPAKLLVETPNATSTTEGTDFFIGHHIAEPAPPAQTIIDSPSNNSSSLARKPANTVTRLLVVSGKVTFSTHQGSATAGPNEAIIAGVGEAPERLTMDANTSFAFDLYAQLVRERPQENLFFSPYSLSSALLMLAEGARGETAMEMGTVLGFPNSLFRHGGASQSIPWEIGKLRSGQASLNRLIQTPTDTPRGDSSLRVASSLWFAEDAPINPSWQSIVTGSYGVESVQSANFTVDAENTRRRINDQTARQTGELIQDLLPPGSLRAETQLSLINAITFQGKWQTPFEPNFTTTQSFTLASGQRIKTDMMSQRDLAVPYAAFEGDGTLFKTPFEVGKGVRKSPDKNGFAIVELFYRGGQLSMVVILPNDPAGLPAIEAQLNPATLDRWLQSLNSRPITLNLPKFRSQTRQPSLRESLISLGMLSAFSTAADFSGLCTTRPLFLDQVTHRATIEVSETGSAAAAAAKSLDEAFTETQANAVEPFNPVFSADRPFLYLIRDRDSGSIVFLGRMLDPSDR